MKPAALLTTLTLLTSLTACATAPAQQQCVPVNKYDHRCDTPQQQEQADTPPGGVLAQDTRITYVITGNKGDEVNDVQYQTGPTEYDIRYYDHGNTVKLPWRVDVDAKAGTRPWVTWGAAPATVTCEIRANGRNIAQPPGAHDSVSSLSTCYAQ